MQLSPLFLSLFLFPLFVSTHAQTQTLIRGTCEFCSQQDPVVDYKFCTTSLEAATRSRHADIRGLGKISIKLTHESMSDTKSYIKKLLKNDVVELSSYVRMRLDDCLELYSNSIIDIKSAMRSYKSRHYDEANILITSVMDAATTCENGFKEKSNVVSPLTKRNNATFELSAIGLTIIGILQSHVN